MFTAASNIAVMNSTSFDLFIAGGRLAAGEFFFGV
jgi:hypothetical protein